MILLLLKLVDVFFAILFLPTYLVPEYAQTCQNTDYQIALNKLTSYLSSILSSSAESTERRAVLSVSRIS